MFDFFTLPAIHAISAAEAECRKEKQDVLQVQHILLGLILQEAGIAGIELRKCDVTVGSIRSRFHIHDVSMPAPDDSSALSFSEEAKHVLELSWDSARNCNHNFVGTEHLLLGLLRAQCPPISKIFSDLGVSTDSLQKAIYDKLAILFDDVNTSLAQETQSLQETIQKLTERAALAEAIEYESIAKAALGQRNELELELAKRHASS